MPIKERPPVQELNPAREKWFQSETPDQPSIRLRRESGGYEAAFAALLSGVGPLRSRGERAEGPARKQDKMYAWLRAMQTDQAIEVVHQVVAGELCCLIQGRAYDGRAENALESARSLWQNLEASWCSEPAVYRFVPSDTRAHLNDEVKRSSNTVPRPAGLRIPGRRPIGYLATFETPKGDVILPHPMARRADYFNALARAALTFSAPVEVRVSLRSFSLPDHAQGALHRALQGDQAPEWIDLDERACGRAQGAWLLEALRLELEQWCNHPTGFRLHCVVSSDKPVPEAVLTAIGHELFHGRPVLWTEASQESQPIAATPQVLDLRNAIPATGALPPLFPAREILIESGVAVQYSKVPSRLPEEGIRLGQVGPAGREREVRFPGPDRTRHSYVLGATGTGKSTLLYNMLMQDIESGAGVCLLDPHGDLYHQVSNAVPVNRINDIVLIEPADVERAVGLNFLECQSPYPQVEMNFIANEMIKIFDRLYDLRQTGGPIFELYMRNALFLVMDNEIDGGTLMDIPLLFEDDKYRRRLLDHCRNPHTVHFWRGQAERAGSELSLRNVAPYVTCKLNQFTCNALLRPIIGQSRSTVDFRACMDAGRIVLVNLSKGLLGELDTRLLGMLIIGKLFNAALQRVNIPANERRPFFLYVDEAQNFTTETVAHLLAEARKFGLYLSLANQTLSQLIGGGYQANLVETILGNVGSLLLFRLGAPDAEKMVAYTRPELGERDLEDLPDHHVVARLLVHGRPSRPFVLRTLASRDPRHTAADEMFREILRKNREHYTRPVVEVEKVIQDRRERVMAEDVKYGPVQDRAGVCSLRIVDPVSAA